MRYRSRHPKDLRHPAVCRDRRRRPDSAAGDIQGILKMPDGTQEDGVLRMWMQVSNIQYQTKSRHSRLMFSARPTDVPLRRSSIIRSKSSRVTALLLKKIGIPPDSIHHVVSTGQRRFTYVVFSKPPSPSKNSYSSLERRIDLSPCRFCTEAGNQ